MGYREWRTVAWERVFTFEAVKQRSLFPTNVCSCASSHPQIEWAARPDYKADIAGATRRAFLEKYCDSGVLVCTMHFPLPSAGLIVPDGNAFRFEYEEKYW